MYVYGTLCTCCIGHLPSLYHIIHFSRRHIHQMVANNERDISVISQTICHNLFQRLNHKMTLLFLFRKAWQILIWISPIIFLLQWNNNFCLLIQYLPFVVCYIWCLLQWTPCTVAHVALLLEMKGQRMGISWTSLRLYKYISVPQ